LGFYAVAAKPLAEVSACHTVHTMSHRHPDTQSASKSHKKVKVIMTSVALLGTALRLYKAVRALKDPDAL
jgi:hypothetical protein